MNRRASGRVATTGPLPRYLVVGGMDVSNRSGFPYAQFDAAFQSDAKVRKLGRDLKDPADFYGALGIWATMIAAVWRTGSREVSVYDECEDAPAPLVSGLIRARLLDSDGHIPSKAFDNWVGRQLDTRKKEADRKRTVRSPSDSGGVRGIPVVSGDSTNSPYSTNSPTEGGVGETDADALNTYYLVTGRFPSESVRKWIVELAYVHGEPRVAERITTIYRQDPTQNSLLGRVRDSLQAEDRAADLKEAAEETARNKRKRAPLPKAALELLEHWAAQDKSDET